VDVPERFGPKIDARAEFVQDRGVLLQLLRELRPDDWERPTAAAPWVVRDVVAHLLGDDLTRLARTRDGRTPLGPGPGEMFVPFLHRVNDEWVRAAQRLSPRLLVDLLSSTSPQVLAMWQEVDQDAMAGPVSWAGPDPAPVWLDCARDFTEYWVHQQQIRDATGRHDLGSAHVVHAVLDTFLRAAPYTLSAHPRPDGTTLAVTVEGAAGGEWTLRCDAQRWHWPLQEPREPTTRVRFPDPEPLWRLCTRMIEPDEAAGCVSVSGDEELATALLQIVSIIR
jgi:uncharacterized protein (TIGR03083 family)